MNDEEMAIRQSSVEASKDRFAYNHDVFHTWEAHNRWHTLSIKVSLFEYRGDGFQFDFTRILAAGALVDTVLSTGRPVGGVRARNSL
jgi:hypothetical protein